MVIPRKSGQDYGEEKGEERAGKKEAKGLFFLTEGGFGRTQSGDCRVDSGGGNCQDDHLHRHDKLVNSHALCTYRVGEEYSIEEADDACAEAGEREDQRSFYKNFFGHMDFLWLFCQYMCSLALTEPEQSDRVNLKSKDVTRNWITRK